MDGSDALSHHGTNGVSAEMSLNVLACNLKLVMNVISTVGLLKAIVAKKPNFSAPRCATAWHRRSDASKRDPEP